MITPLPEMVGAHTTLDLIPSNRLDEPLLILRVVELVCDRRQVKPQLIGDELANLRVIVVPLEKLDIGSVSDQVDVNGAVAER